MDDRKAMNGIFYVLRTGCHWKALPKSLGAATTVHDRFQEWRNAEVFQNMWKEGLLEYDAVKGINWEWQAMDGAIKGTPRGEKAPDQIPQTGQNLAQREACWLKGTEFLSA